MHANRDMTETGTAREADHSGTGRWERTQAADLRPGNLIRIGGTEARLTDRDYPGGYSPIFTAVLDPGNVKHAFAKSTEVDVFREAP